MPRKKQEKKQTAPVEVEKPTNGEAHDLEVVEVPKAKKNGKSGVDPHAFSADGDLVDIWERRMLNPTQRPSLPIRLTTPGMHIRWINLASNGRYQRARYEEGWVPVSKNELLDEREIYGVSYTSEGWVCRGEKQTEMLMKIPEAIFKKIQRAKFDQVEKSRRQIKDNMQAAGAKHFGDKYNSNRGDEIAETLSAFKGDVRFGTEAVSPDGEEAAMIESSLE